MRTQWTTAWVAGATLVLTGLAGCGTLDVEQLARDAVAGITDQTAQQPGALNAQETQFAPDGQMPQFSQGQGGPGRHGPLHPPRPPLSEEQMEQLLALRDQYDNGEITLEQFCEQAILVIGEPPCGPPLPPIDLTAEQQELAEAIFAAARDETLALFATARENVYTQLTEDQAATLLEIEEAIEPPPVPPLLPPDWPQCDAPEPSCERPALVPLRPCPPPPGDNGDMPPMGPFAGMSGTVGGPPQGMDGAAPGQCGQGPGGERGPHGPPPPPLCMSPDLIEDLALTNEQIEAIEFIHDDLRVAAEAVRDTAWESFLDLLTEEQLEQLEQLPPPPPHRP